MTQPSDPRATGRPAPTERTHVWGHHVALVSAQISFAGFAVIGKAVLGELDPRTVATLRILVSTPLLFAFAWMVERHLPRPRDLPALALLGFLGVFLNQLLFILGLERSTATNVSILVVSIPIFTGGLAVLSRIERASTARSTGIGLAILGTLVMLDPLGVGFSASSRLGNALVLMNCLAYSAFLVLQRPVLARVPPWTLTAWSFLFGGVGILAVCAPAATAESWSTVPRWVFAGLLYVTIVPTGIGHALMSWSIRRSSPSLAAAYTTLQPVVAGVLAALFLDERLRWAHALGLGLIVTGLVLVSAPPNRFRRKSAR